jgi:NADH-quinone oxidoreductase subunit H
MSLFFVLIWFRGTFPRFRIDQVMAFSWKFLLPLSLANIFIVAVDYYVPGIAGFILAWILMLATFFAVWAVNSRGVQKPYKAVSPVPPVAETV